MQKIMVWILKFFPIVLIIVSCEKDVSVSTPEPPAANGKIVLTSVPENYMIYLNGQITGQMTPDSMIFLEDGDYTISLHHYLYLDSTFSVTVSNESDVSKEIDMESNPDFVGSIECTSTPSYASILLDDSNTGLTTPATLPGVYPGDHIVRYSLTGYRDIFDTTTVFSRQASSFYKVLEDTTIWLKYNKINSPLVSNNLSCLAINFDGDNAMWVGTFDAGIIKMQYPDWPNYNFNNSPLKGSYIQGLDMSDAGKLGIATLSGLYFLEDGNWTMYNPENSSLLNEKVSTIICYDRSMWSSGGSIHWVSFFIGTVDAGFNMIDEEGNWYSFTKENSNLPSNKIKCMALRQRELLAIGTKGGGVATTSVNGSGVFTVYDMTNSPFLTNDISAVKVDNLYSRLWVGVSLGGLIDLYGQLLYGDDEGWTEVDIGSYYVYDIELDFTTTWVATNHGLLKIENFQVVEKFDSENSPLDSDPIYDIEIDRTGKLWMATGSGLVRYTKD